MGVTDEIAPSTPTSPFETLQAQGPWGAGGMIPNANGLRPLDFETSFDRLNHYLFRYPAKFHPPVVRALLREYTDEGDVVLDPFCGSGTTLVEASLLGRSSFGVDVDPLAVAVTNAKVRRYRASRLRENADRLLADLEPFQRSAGWYDAHAHSDLSEAEFRRQIGPVAEYIPEIPNIHHWFRRYVIVDLAYMRRAVTELSCSEPHRAFLATVFASIIRNVSNADPVPVSGLEYTAHMKRLDEAGRIVNPWGTLVTALRRAVQGADAFAAAARQGVTAEARPGDATDLAASVDRKFDAVLTSPPYHGAVDYYRRHQLEQFWLGMTQSQSDRLALLGKYIGRPKVPQKDRFVRGVELATELARRWEETIRAVAPERANAFRHYIAAMSATFSQLSAVVKPGGATLFVVGHSQWNGTTIPTTDLFQEISQGLFNLEEVRWYPVKNRYMSYSRGNNASIDTEYVLVLRRVKD